MWRWGRRKPGSVDPAEPSARPDGQAKKRSEWGRIGRWTAWVAFSALAIGSIAAPTAVGLSAAGNTVLNLWDELPTDLPVDRPLAQHTVVLDKNGKEFARFYSENRVEVKQGQVSKAFQESLVATEDARFYEHHGVDPWGVTRALLHNLANEDVQGASTITQQLVQNILVNNARNGTEEMVGAGDTYNAKIREARYAIALEKKLSKGEILTRYMNAVYFGNGAYGVEAAAHVYFNTTAAKLNHVQSALLVGLLKGPVTYDPFAHPAAGTERRNTVLTVLERQGVLTPEQARAARARPLGVKRGSPPSGCAGSSYPFYCELVREEILTNPAFGRTAAARRELLAQGGITLTTALDPQAAKAAQAAVEKALGNHNRVALGTAVVVPGTGHIAAIAQNREWGQGRGKTEVVYAKRGFQVGSSMKPIVLATALSQGIPPSTRLRANGPYRSAKIDNPRGGYVNYGNRNYGVINAYKAIRSSVNIYFVRLIERVGVINTAKMARRLGISSLPIDQLTGREASLALGAYEVSPLEMANAYAAFMSGGVVCTPVTVIKAVRTETKEKLPVPKSGCHKAISRSVANTVASILREPFKPTGTLAQLGRPKGRDAGAKTGTTNDFAANWIVGGTPQLIAAVWLGDPRGGAQHPLTRVEAFGTTYYDLTGAEVAGPVWKATMEGALQGRKAVRLPQP